MSLSDISLSCLGRLRSTSARFARSEHGGATIWNVTWLLVFAGMAGLSIDASNGYRNIAISQSTGDAASLAGVMQLPNPLRQEPFNSDEDAYNGTVKAKALEYAGKNMPWNPYGQVLMPDEIFIGNWSNKNGERRFTAGQQFDELVPDHYDSVDDVPVNAVRVYLFQDEEDRGNGVATSLMHMAGMPYWKVVTTATAMAGYPKCLTNAFMAKKKFCQTSNSTYGKDVCLWADEGFKLNNNNNWEGNYVQSPPGANNAGVRDSNYEDPDFWMQEDVQPALDVQFVEDIATFNDGQPGIAYDILSGGSHYAQETTIGTAQNGDPNRTAPSGDVIRLEINTIGTVTESSWLDSEPSIQVAGLDGFASVAGLLGFAQSPGRVTPGCPNQSNGSLVEPIADYDRDIFGIEDEDETAEEKFPNVKFAVDSDGNDVIHASRDLDAHTIYYHDDPKGLTIDGKLDSVVIVSRGEIVIKGDSVLTDVTLVSLEDRKGGGDGISINNSVTFGTANGLCNEDGGVKMYTMGSVTSSQGAQFNGAFIASGGNVQFAANANSEQGVSVYAAGNIFHTSNNIITACGVPISYDPDNIRYSIVD